MNCEGCTHARKLPESAHFRCTHRGAADPHAINAAMHSAGYGVFLPKREPKVEVTLDRHGFSQGWAFWPANFDPVWIKTCSGFQAVANTSNTSF